MEKLFMEGKWDQFHVKEEFHTKYPSEHAVRFLAGQFPRNLSQRKKMKILDLGCGAGRHTSLLAKEGFETYATDISVEAIKVTEQRLARDGLKGVCKKANMERLPYADNYFDGIISFGVIYYNDRTGVINAVSEIYRTLKEGGKAFILTTTTDDYRYAKGSEIERNTFILDINETNEGGMVLHFLERKEIAEIFNKFKDITIEKSEVTFANSEKKNSHWIIIVRK